MGRFETRPIIEISPNTGSETELGRGEKERIEEIATDVAARTVAYVDLDEATYEEHYRDLINFGKQRILDRNKDSVFPVVIAMTEALVDSIGGAEKLKEENDLFLQKLEQQVIQETIDALRAKFAN